MSPRTIAQLALLIIGLVVWGVGARGEDNRLRWIGIACFGIAFLLRVLRRKLAPKSDDGPSS